MKPPRGERALSLGVRLIQLLGFVQQLGERRQQNFEYTAVVSAYSPGSDETSNFRMKDGRKQMN